jgi:hypothetical protein
MEIRMKYDQQIILCLHQQNETQIDIIRFFEKLYRNLY